MSEKQPLFNFLGLSSPTRVENRELELPVPETQDSPDFFDFLGPSSSTKGDNMELESPEPETQDSPPLKDFLGLSSSTIGLSLVFGSPARKTQKLLKYPQLFIGDLHSSSARGVNLEFGSPARKTQKLLKHPQLFIGDLHSSSARGQTLQLGSLVPQTQKRLKDSFRHSSSAGGKTLQFESLVPKTQKPLKDSFRHSSSTRRENTEFGSPVPKTRKLLEDSSMDNISRLPDEILARIFSFLFTKEVVRTSILSKRWKNVWTLAPNVDFKYHFEFNPVYDAKLRLFEDYVDNVLFHHGGLDIKKCILQCATSPHIYTWICAVLSCNVEELTIKSSFIGTYKELPWNLFTCKTLVSLRIDGGFVLNLPYLVWFPCLKKLHLDSLIYVDDSSMQRLFSSCLVLEELNLKRVRGDCVLIAKILIPSLKRVYLDVPHLEHIPDHEYKTNINAPCLEYLEMRDSASRDCSLNFSAYLVEAKILGRCPLLVAGISNVQVLKLSGEAVESWTSSSHATKWPTLNNLYHLELGVSSLGWGLLSHFLNSSPNLETLVFTEGLLAPKDDSADDDYGGFHGFYWIPPDSVPQCLLSCLQTIRIRNFVGRKCEIFLVRYMLKHAQVLQEMTIHWWYDVKWGKKTSVQRQILSISTCSEDCQVKLI